MNRPSNIIPLHRGARLVVVRPHQPEPHRQVADLSEWLNRRAYRDPEGEYVWAELQRHCARHPLSRRSRHISLDPVRWLDLICIAVAVFVVSVFAAALVGGGF